MGLHVDSIDIVLHLQRANLGNLALNARCAAGSSSQPRAERDGQWPPVPSYQQHPEKGLRGDRIC